VCFAIGVQVLHKVIELAPHKESLPGTKLDKLKNDELFSGME
jgi:hypothetical protein